MSRRKSDPNAPTLRTVAELDRAQADAQARKAAALQKLANDGRHSTAVAELNRAKAELKSIADERVTIREIEAVRNAGKLTADEQRAVDEAHRIAKQIPKCIVEQGEQFAELLAHLEKVADLTTTIEESQAANFAAIRGLPGQDRRREMLWRAARNVAIALPLRPALQALSKTKLLDPWVSVKVPAEIDRTPMHRETHAAAAERVAAIPRTVEGVFAETAANVERLAGELLGPELAPEPTGVAWHGSTKSHPGPSSAELILPDDDTPRRQARHARRVANTAKPIEIS